MLSNRVKKKKEGTKGNTGGWVQSKAGYSTNAEWLVIDPEHGGGGRDRSDP